MMRTNLRTQLCVISALICVIGNGVRSGEITCEYLSEPLDDTKPDAYRALLKKELLTSSGDYGVILMMPAVSGEWAVSASMVKPKDDTRAYQLSYTSASDNLHDAKFGSNQSEQPIKVRRIDVEIDEKFAMAIQSVWRGILSKDQRPSKEDWRESTVVVDGYSADLSVMMEDGKIVARRALDGQGPPASEIVKLGFDLRDYCLNRSEERPKRQREIIDRIRKLSEQLEKCNDVVP